MHHGTYGKFDIGLDATGSEVGINYNIQLVLENKPVNLHFYKDSEYTEEVFFIDNISTIVGDIELQQILTEQIVSIYWNWPYETGEFEEDVDVNDVIDSEDMTKGSIQVSLNVTGTQKNPQITTQNLASVVSVGDYVNYDEGTDYTYTALGTETGTIDAINAVDSVGTYGYYSRHLDYTEYDNMDSTGNQTFATENLNWRVLDVTGDTVTLIADTATNSNLTLYSGKAVLNGVTIMNELCSSLYGNGYGVQQARALNVEDINKCVGITDGTTISSTYGKKYEAGWGCWADGTPAKGRIIRSTIYYYNSKNYMDTSSKESLLLKSYNVKSWLASLCIDAYSENANENLTNFHFHIRTFISGSVGATTSLWHSDRWVNYFSYPVIPIVVLNSGIQTTGQNNERSMAIRFVKNYVHSMTQNEPVPKCAKIYRQNQNLNI